MSAARVRLRQVAAPVVFAAQRLRKRSGRTALVFAGIALAAAMLASVLAIGLAVEDKSLSQAITRLEPGDRFIRENAFIKASHAQSVWGRMNPATTKLLRQFGTPIPMVLLVADQATFVPIVVMDDLRAVARLQEGRLPRKCASDCELLAIGYPDALQDAGGRSFYIVGSGSLRHEGLIGFGGLSGFYLADGIESLALPASQFSDRDRVFIWAVPLGPGSVHPWSVDSFISKVQQADSAFGAALGPEAVDGQAHLEAPIPQLRAAQRSVRTAQSRLLLVSGQGIAVLLAFIVMAGSRLRTDIDAAVRRLRSFGARPWQASLYVAVEAALISLAATAVGWLIGSALSLGFAAILDAPGLGILFHSALAGPGIAAAATLAGAAALLLYVTLRIGPIRVGGRSLSGLDLAALGATAVVVVALLRGAPDARSLASERGTGILLLLVPGLLALVAAVVTARFLTPALRTAARAAGRVPIALRLAALSAGRRAGQSTLAAAFVVVSVGIGVFATNYRSTLIAGQREGVDYETPYPLMLSEDTQQLATPASVAPASAYPGEHVVPILRLASSVARLDGDNGAEVLGVPPGALAPVRGWRSDFSSLDLRRMGQRIRPSFRTDFSGAPIPADVRRLTIPVRARGAPLAVSGKVLTALGEFISVDLGTTHDHVLRAQLPRSAIGGQLVSIEFQPADVATEGDRRAGEFESASVGQLDLGPVSWLRFERFVGVGGIDPVARGHSVHIRFAITTQATARLRAREPVDRHVLPAVVSPRLAKAAGERGLLPVDVVGTPVVVRVVGIASHFPSIHGDFMVADRQALAAMMNTADPTTPFFNEVWIDDPDLARVRKQLRYAPFDQLSVRSRATVRGQTFRAPLSRGAELVLSISALTAFGLAAIGIVLAAAAAARDERRELFDLEAHGADPRLLRRQLRLRVGLYGVAGVVGGMATGIVLSEIVVGVVAVTAGARTPDPPLVLTVDWLRLIVEGVVSAGIASALVLLVTGAAERRRWPLPRWLW